MGPTKNGEVVKNFHSIFEFKINPKPIAEREQEWKKRMARERERQRGQRIRAAKPRTEPKVGRNAPCPCGSGKKYKKCHGRPGA